ncbi:siderophore-interacting protein [Actinocorallia sp. A-T 12471]|uniref:siderophore-interacting protein n=1 Tax=Actinocorallia sp. A-T 12471 TaxID=3089813 RepID=UPI0029CD7DFF|nr:siderophore-interacting protein [Actinocorallia sp. A-T 12471]MDX6743011.1 siderophore-interacting protein [Actinocorallia sp. A-T 12471]
MALGERLVDALFARGTVAEVDFAAARVRAIRLRVGADLAWRPGQQVRVHVNDLLSGLRKPFDILRTYSVWDYDGVHLDLRVLDHGDGPGAGWARALSAGDEVVFGKPEGGFVVRPEAGLHLFVGEETALGAFGPMTRAVADASPGVPCHSVVEVAGPDDRLPLEGDVTWLYRGQAPAYDSATLAEAVAGLDLPPDNAHAYLAGEAKTCQSVKKALLAKGWARRSIHVKPFWTPGKRGMD